MKLQATITLDFTQALTLGFTLDRTIRDNEDRILKGGAFGEIARKDNERLLRIRAALDTATETHNMRLVEA